LGSALLVLPIITHPNCQPNRCSAMCPPLRRFLMHQSHASTATTALHISTVTTDTVRHRGWTTWRGRGRMGSRAMRMTSRRTPRASTPTPSLRRRAHTHSDRTLLRTWRRRARSQPRARRARSSSFSSARWGEMTLARVCALRGPKRTNVFASGADAR